MDYLQYETLNLEKMLSVKCFKPYYKWITFNTTIYPDFGVDPSGVLNLIINGLPSIRKS